MADDVAALLDKLGIATVDVMGCSLGGGVALQTAIRHPDRVGKLIVISMSIRDDGNFPEVQAQFDSMPDMAPEIRAAVPAVATRCDVSRCRLGSDVAQDRRDASGAFDWSADVANIASPTLLIYADADMMYLEHMVEFYRLLGGGTRDAGFDGSLRPTPNQLAIIPGTTHYDLMLTATESATDYAKAFLAR